MIRHIFLAAGVLLLFFASCTKDKKPAPVAPVASDCDSTKILFCNEIKSIINSNCATSGCHISGGNGPGDFSTYSGIKEKADNGTLRLRVLEMRNMPPSQPLSASDTTLISKWLSEGAKEK